MRKLVLGFIPIILLLFIGCDQLLNQDKTTPPVAPRQLAVQLNENGTIEFSWIDDSDNESGFKIEYQTQGSIVWNLVAEVGRNVTSYAWSGAQENTTYTFRIYAFNDTDDSDFTYWNNPVTVPLFAPTELTATVSGTTIVLGWQDNSQVEESYRVERKTASGSFAEIATLSANVKTHSDTDFPSGADLVYRVIAVGGGNESSPSNEASVTAPILLVAPSDLTAEVVNRTIVLNWTDNSDIETGFAIERKKAGSSYGPLETVGADVTTYTDTNFPFDTDLTYQVFAVAGEEFSYPSNEASVHSPVQFVTVYEDDFESYQEGYFIGDPWDYGVTDPTQVVFGILTDNPAPNGGNKNLSFWDITDPDWGYADLPFDAFSAGRIEFDLNVVYDSSNPYLDFGIGLSVDQVWLDFSDFGPYVEFASDGILHAANGSDFSSTWEFPTNQWFHMVIGFNVSNGTYRILADGNVVYDGLAFFNNKSGNNIVGFSLLCYSNTSLWAAQIDNLRVMSLGSTTTTSTSKPSTGLKRGPVRSLVAR